MTTPTPTTLHEWLLVDDRQINVEQVYSNTHTISNEYYRIDITGVANGFDKIISNPVLVMEFEDAVIDVNELNISSKLEINGARIEHADNYLQDKTYNIYKLEPVAVHANQIYIPIPFGSMVNGQGILVEHDKHHKKHVCICVMFENTDRRYYERLKNMCIRTTVHNIMLTKDDCLHMNQYYFTMFMQEYPRIYQYCIKLYRKQRQLPQEPEQEQETPLQLQLTDYNIYRCTYLEFCGLESVKDIQQNKNRFKCMFNFIIRRFFISFQQNTGDNNWRVYAGEKPFDALQITADGNIIYEMDFETLCTHNNTNPDFPPGIYEIDYAVVDDRYKNLSHVDNCHIHFLNLSVPSSSEYVLAVHAETVFYLLDGCLM
jgi:hypothetical protein